MRAPQSLKWRLVLSASGTAALVVTVLTAAFLALLQHRLQAEERTVVVSHAQAVAATISIGKQGQLLINDGPADALLDAGVWVFAGGQAVEHPQHPSAVDSERALSLAGTNDRLVRDHGKEFASVGVAGRAGTAGTVVAAISLLPYERTARLSLYGAVGLGAALIALVSLLSLRTAERALRPVADMAQQARTWSEHGTSRRFGPAGRPRELADLAADLDTLLDRLAAVVRHEHQLSGEISHELRTPLAAIIAEAELFLAKTRSAAQASEAMDAILTGSRRLEGILDTLLAAARAERAPNGRSDVLQTLEHLGVEWKGPADVPAAGVDGALLERLLTPLLDNARRYGTQTSVGLRVQPDAIVLDVIDNGPGVPPGAEARVFEAGFRLDPQEAHQGSGLGLALARRLANASGAQIACIPGSHGRFVVTLPRA